MQSKSIKNIIETSQKAFNSCFKSFKDMYELKTKEQGDKLKETRSEMNLIIEQNLELKSSYKNMKVELQQLERTFEEYKKTQAKLNSRAKLKSENEGSKVEFNVKNIKSNTNRDKYLFLGKFEEERILKEIKDLLSENDNLRDYAREIKSEMEYGKQRENKLMYFLYVLQQKGCPVYEVFDKDIRHIVTSRFSKDLDEEYKNVYYQEQAKKHKNSKCRQLDIIRSYKVPKPQKLSSRIHSTFISNDDMSLPLEIGPSPKQAKPRNVPILNFDQGNDRFENKFMNSFADKKSKIRRPKSAELNYDESSNEAESDWSCSYCMAMKDSEKDEYEKQSLFKYNEDKILNSQEKEERNQRVEQLLLQDNNDKYINIKNINKMHQFAESFSKNAK